MKRTKIAPYFLSMLLLTVGAAGVVSAYSALPEYREQVLAQLETTPVPLSEEGEAAPATLIQPSVETPQPLQPQAESTFGPVANPLDNRVDFLNDWYQAGAKRNESSEVRRLHVIFLDANRALTGRITVLGSGQTFRVADETLTLHFTQHGRIVQSVPLGTDGRFTVTGLSKGAYGLGVLGSNTMLAYSVYLGSMDDLVDAGYDKEEINQILNRQASEPLQIDSVAISPTDFPMAIELVREAVSRDVTRRTLANNMRLHIPPGVDFAGARAGTTLRSHAVKLRTDGSLLGRVRKPVDQANGKVSIESIPGVELIFLQNNTAVASAVTDVDGEFEVRGLMVGNYSVVARSVEGIAVLGMRVFASNANLNVNRDIQAPASDSYQTVLFDEEEKDLNLDGTLNNKKADSELNLNDLQLDVTLMEDFGLLLEELPVEEEHFEGVGAEGAFGGVAGAAGGGGGLLGFLLGGLIGGLIGGSLGDDDPNPGDDPVTPDMP